MPQNFCLSAWVTSHAMESSASTTPLASAFLVIRLVDRLVRCYWPTNPFTLNIKCHLRLVHPGLDPKTIEVSDWIVEKQIARPAWTTKAEKGEKVWRITVHVDKEAQEGTAQATTTGDEGGDKYGTPRPASEADEDWRLERRKSNESDKSDTDSSSTTNSSSGGTSSESSSASGNLHSSTKVVVATGHKKVYKKTAKQPRGQAKQAKSGKTAVVASLAQQRQALERKSSSDSKRQRK